jgi:acyl dehydratase
MPAPDLATPSAPRRFDPDRVRAYKVADCRDRYDPREAILYALGVGAGLGGIDEQRFIYEHGLVTLPTMALVLGTPGFWLMDRALGFDWPRILHGEQSLRLRRKLAPQGDIMGRTTIGAICDKGPGRAVAMRCARTLADGGTGAPVAELEEVWILRGAGGFGGETAPVGLDLPPVPGRAADHVLDLPTFPQQAALYRLTGDRNPLHIDPAAAALGGFARPILHGLATFGVIGRALIAGVCGGDAGRLSAMRLRFTLPVYPGDLLRTEQWREDGAIRFRASVPARGEIVADGGVAELDGFDD